MVVLLQDANLGARHSAGGRTLLSKDGRDEITNVKFLGNEYSRRA